MAVVNALFRNNGVPVEVRQAALDRAHSDPGIPDAAHTTSSFWLKDPNRRITELQASELPSEADVVIIGSGITGTSVAHTILNACKGAAPSSRPRVVMLDARDVCSGATGRNGGHILETAEEYAPLKESFGKAAAQKIVRFRLAHLDVILAIAQELGLDEACQARRVRFLSVYFDRDRWDEAQQSIAVFKQDMPTEASGWEILDADTVREHHHIPRSFGAIAGPAGALWPYKLVTGILAHLHARHPADLVLAGNTPVTAIDARPQQQQQQRGGRGALVHTPRGSIRAAHVVHCTNAHAGHLLPGLRGAAYAVQGQMSAQAPGEGFLPSLGRERSWVFNYDRGFDYLTQLPVADSEGAGGGVGGEMMLGGGLAQSAAGGLGELGIATDADVGLYPDIHLRGALAAVFAGAWGAVRGPQVKAMWTGNMGFSGDGLPWVGAVGEGVTGRRGGAREWVAAAFSGEGMVNAWLCGKAVGAMLVESEGGEVLAADKAVLERLPEQMLISEKRVKEARMPRRVEDFDLPEQSLNARL